MKITVVADEVGEVIAAVVHPLGDPSTGGREGVRIKPSEHQSVVVTDAPDELKHRIPDAGYLDILRREFSVKDGALVRRQ